MTKQATYRVVANGGILNGFQESDVVNAFAKLFDMTQEKALTYLEPNKLVNHSLTKSRADDYKVKIESLGIPVTVQCDEPESQPEASATQTISCPKCQLAQAKSTECTGCGIIFEKYNNRNETESPLETTSTVKDTDSADSSLPLFAFIAPLIAALIGAFVWKGIALSFGYELGLIAWAIGGAVGAAAVITGGRGDVMGGYCAVITLLAIFAGKYMIMSSVQLELATLFESESGSAMMTELYEEAEYDAQAFAVIDKSDASVKAFMVDHYYTDADEAIFVTDRELEDFRADIQPFLESDDPTQIYTAELGNEPSFAAAMSSASPTSMVFESLGFIDLLFAFFGLSTAFQLGRSGFKK